LLSISTIDIAIVERAITIWEAIQKKSYEPIYKTYTKYEAKGLRAITKGGAIEKRPILLSQYWINEEFELIQ
jgi:hypothetical protein